MWAAAEAGGGPGAATQRLLLAALVIVLLAGCATTRAPRSLLPADAQENLLRDLLRFEAKGRASVTTGQRREMVPNLEWTQRQAQSRIRMSGPFGAGSVTVEWSPAGIRVSSGREVYEGAAAEAILAEQLGITPPFEALRYWLLGLEAPGEPALLRNVADNGRTGELTQQGWNIRYDRWVAVAAPGGGVELPGRVIIRRDDLTLGVIVERWKL